MRRTVVGTALLVTAAALLTGCGGDSGKKGKHTGGDSHEAAAAQGSSGGSAAGSPATHEVTLEVTGKGTTQIMYNLTSNHFEQHELPWTKTETIELTATQQRVGWLVSVVPGSVKAADGTLQPASCVIKVDGKQVADNTGGKKTKHCSYTLH